MSDHDIEVGEFYELSELPENVMNNSGKPEWVSDDTLAVATEDGAILEFKMAARCKAIGEVDKDDGSVEMYETLEGEEASHG